MSDDQMTPVEVALDSAVRMAMTTGITDPLHIVEMAAVFLAFLDGEELPERSMPSLGVIHPDA